MKWETVWLEMNQAEVNGLKEHNAKVMKHLEEGFPLRIDVLAGLKGALSAVLNKERDFQRVMEGIRNSGEHVVVQLVHDNNEILNLPWGLAVEQVSGQELGSMERLYLTKTRPEFVKGEAGSYQPRVGGPLKVLVMIASPEDGDFKKTLDYDAEELEILKAFTPLLQSGEVQIDFTDDGSLETLKEKLRANKYHLLHFSGHGVFKDGEGYLALEDPLNLKNRLAASGEFAEALCCNPDHLVPLVVLSSCQTAQGATEEGLRGVTNRLLQAGVPAVVAMGMSIKDQYAAAFSARLYQELAGKRKIPVAFQAALRYLREFEGETNRRDPRTKDQVPLQWMIPNLYLRAPMDDLVEWGSGREEIRYDSFRFLMEQNRLVLRHENERNYRFIGRRKEKAEILEPLFKKVPVLLRGQGGVGKTALAEHLVQRLIARDPRVHPFVFDEKIGSSQEIIDALRGYLIEHGQTEVILVLSHLEKPMEKLSFLLSKLEEICAPVFIFDNLESFQREPGKGFAEKHQDLADVIEYLCRSGRFYMILTCRYPVEIENVREFDLNQVGFNDFWKKCNTLAIKNVKEGMMERAEVDFAELIKLLYKTFGGNYRALEFFDKLYVERPETLRDSLHSLEELKREIDSAGGHVKEFMGENLIFKRLLGNLDEDCQVTLQLLAHFKIPVHALAVKMQLTKEFSQGLDKVLERLNHLTLLEISLDRELNALYYYITPLVKDLLGDYELKDDRVQFSAQKAGLYHYHICENVELSLADLEAAFEWFYQVLDKEKVNEIGEQLSGVYYNLSMFQNSFYYCRQVYQLLEDDIDSSILNRMGQIYHLYGQRDHALSCFTKLLPVYQKNNDKSGEGTTLNNISSIFHAQGDYETALGYLEQSLRVSREFGDKSAERASLSNIGSIFYHYCPVNDHEQWSDPLSLLNKTVV